MSLISAQILRVCQQAPRFLFGHRNVVACGLGYKTCDGEMTEELSLVVSVVKKFPREQLTPQDLIPQEVEGLRTDVVETGRIRAQFPKDPKARYRPAQPGVSIGHPNVTAGTFGFLVQREGEPFILSNNHVLANRNNAEIGDPIYQPGPIDGGGVADQIATLAEFKPLDFGTEPAQCTVAETTARFVNWLAKSTGSQHRMQPVQVTSGENDMDAALAYPEAPALVAHPILGLDAPNGLAEPVLGMEVQKVGRTTGHTLGIVRQIHVTVSVDFEGRSAVFNDQVLAGRMSSPGDSGSGILDMEGRAVGLLFAGSETVTIFTPLRRILDYFRVQLVVL